MIASTNNLLSKTFLDEDLQKFIKQDELKYGYGVWVPLEILNEARLGYLLSKTGLFKNYSIRNPKMGEVLEQVREKLKYTRQSFGALIGKQQAHYTKVVKNRIGINLQKFLQLPNKKEIQSYFKLDEIEEINWKIEEIIIDKNSAIFKRGFKDFINFYPANLESIKISHKEYVILPTCKWEIRGLRENLRDWCLNFYSNHKRSPMANEFNSEFRGFIDYERRYYKRSFSDFLRECNLPINSLKNYDWSKPSIIKKARKFVRNYYKENGNAPTSSEFINEFGGGLHKHLYRAGKKYNDFIRECKVPENNMENGIKVGIKFDKIGKNCMKYVNESYIKNYRVYYPQKDEIGYKFVVPDGIFHDFNKNPLTKFGKNIYLKKGQRLDEILEFKSNYGGMGWKEYQIYSKIAKKMIIFLLKGSASNFEKHDCKIIFFTKNEFIGLLESKINLFNKVKVENLIKKLHMLDKGLDIEVQTEIQEFI